MCQVISLLETISTRLFWGAAIGVAKFANVRHGSMLSKKSVCIAEHKF